MMSLTEAQLMMHSTWGRAMLSEKGQQVEFEHSDNVLTRVYASVGRCEDCKFALVFGDDPTGTVMCDQHDGVSYHARDGFCERFVKND